MSAALLVLLLWVVPGSRAQQVGDVSEEAAPALTVRSCSGSKCEPEELSVTLDAQYRWLHDVDGYDNCFDAGSWDEERCETGVDCAKNCAIDGVDKKGYPNTYGVAATPDGIELTFAVKGEYGTNYGSRVYVLDGEDTYKMFKLKNREFSFDVDISKLPCGLNGAVYFVAMDSKGDFGKGQNEAGAKYGLGYCDAQCPRGQKFVEGVANLEGWDASTNMGKVGACCAELDLFEANKNSSAMTVHPCASEEPETCEDDECDKETICDKDGCQYNPYHMGNPWFYGPGETFTIDTTKKFTVVTQFITEDGTDEGDLIEMRRFYIQGGKTWALPNVSGAEKTKEHVTGNSLTDGYCSAKNGDKLFGVGGDRRLAGAHTGRLAAHGHAAHAAHTSHAAVAADAARSAAIDEALSSAAADKKGKHWDAEKQLDKELEALGLDRVLEEPPEVVSNGYMKKMGEALDRGMVLILSVWDDQATNMAWLDASSLVGQSESGGSTVWEGPCFEDSAGIRDNAPDSSVAFTDIAYGELFSTCPSCKDAEIPSHRSEKKKKSRSTTPPPQPTSSAREEPAGGETVPATTGSSTEPPWVFDKSTTPPPATPTPLFMNFGFLTMVVLGGSAAAGLCAWSYLKSQGWELRVNRLPGFGGSAVPGSPTAAGGGSLVRPSE
jgi:cellulose 1,4-beta-cellobiosidase